jgi:hypothetical protein
LAALKWKKRVESLLGSSSDGFLRNEGVMSASGKSGEAIVRLFIDEGEARR